MVMKKIIIVFIVIILIGVGAYLFTRSSSENVEVEPNQPVNTNPIPIQIATNTIPTPSQPPADGPISVIGKSVEGNDITAYNYGTGDKELLFIGGIHTYGFVKWDFLNAERLLKKESISVIDDPYV